MNNHPPQPLLHRPTTTQILKQTTAVFYTRHHLLPFLLLSLFLLSFRVQNETVTKSLTSFINNNPSIKSLFPPKPTIQNHHHHLAEEINLFEGNDENDHGFVEDRITSPQLYNLYPIPVHTHLWFSNSSASASIVNQNTEIEHQDSSALFAYGGFMFSYGLMVLFYILSKSSIHGIVFVLVVNHFLNNRNPFITTFRRGMILGTNRLAYLNMIRWAIRESLAQILCVWFFGQIEDGYLVFKIVLRSKFLSISDVLPWVRGFEKESIGFLLSYIWLDMLISFAFAVGVWVVMADSRKTCGEIIREGCYMLSLAILPAISLKCLEVIVSGSFAEFRLSKVFGRFLASVIQSLMVVYFMVAWKVYYFSVKSVDANARGVTFGQTEFQAMLKHDQ